MSFYTRTTKFMLVVSIFLVMIFATGSAYALTSGLANDSGKAYRQILTTDPMNLTENSVLDTMTQAQIHKAVMSLGSVTLSASMMNNLFFQGCSITTQAGVLFGNTTAHTNKTAFSRHEETQNTTVGFTNGIAELVNQENIRLKLPVLSCNNSVYSAKVIR